MQQKERAKIFMTISNLKKTFGIHGYTTFFQCFKGYPGDSSHVMRSQT